MSAEIILNNVSLKLPVYGAKSSSFKNTLASSLTGGKLGKDTKVTTIEALKKISIHLKNGDKLGVYGHNGAGKSTILRLLAGVYAPTSGTYKRVGTLNSLIDPSMGIEPDATGAENVKMRGVILGLSKNKISELLKDVTEFSGLGGYINLPVRTYSSGMQMRLAFAMSTAIKSDILLMDEWLSVGDIDFQRKAEKRMRSMLSNVGILILVSHSHELLRAECNKFLHLEHGEIVGLDVPK